MANRHKIYPEINFGVAKVDPGPVSFKELYDFALEIRNNKDFLTVKYHITDLRGSNFEFSIKNLEKMKSLIESYEDEDHKRTGVYIVDLPNETAYIHIFFDSLGKNREYCSTIEKAYSLLSLPISFEEFLEKIDI